MAEFTGTITEFKKFVGPRVRNVVQMMTKTKKKEQSGRCQICGLKAELEAAHKKGMSRNNIIENLLSNHKIDERNVRIDLETFDKEIIKAHTPIDDYFLFLCPDCHRKYDNESRAPKKILVTSHKPQIIKGNGQGSTGKAEVLDMVRAYCEDKSLSEGTTRSALSHVRQLMSEYREIPEPVRVKEDMLKRGADRKSISNRLWALKIWSSIASS